MSTRSKLGAGGRTAMESVDWTRGEADRVIVATGRTVSPGATGGAMDDVRIERDLQDPRARRDRTWRRTSTVPAAPGRYPALLQYTPYLKDGMGGRGARSRSARSPWRVAAQRRRTAGPGW